LAGTETELRTGNSSIDGTEYTLAKNNGDNSLHGGIKGFNKAMWEAKDVSKGGEAAVEMEIREQGWRRGISRELVGDGGLYADE